MINFSVLGTRPPKSSTKFGLSFAASMASCISASTVSGAVPFSSAMRWSMDAYFFYTFK